MKLIVATDEKNGIGLNGDIPWKGVHNDFLFFKSMTYGSNVVMGRKTYESIGSKPLEGRGNWVIGTGEHFQNKEAFLDDYHDKYSLMNFRKRDMWVIGGAGIYDLCMPYVTEMFITQIPGDWKCDTFFNMPYNFRGAGSFVLNGGLKVERWLI